MRGSLSHASLLTVKPATSSSGSGGGTGGTVVGGSGDGSLVERRHEDVPAGAEQRHVRRRELDLPAGIHRSRRYDDDDDRQLTVTISCGPYGTTIADPSTASGVPGSSSRFARRASANGAASESRAVPRAPWAS